MQLPGNLRANATPAVGCSQAASPGVSVSSLWLPHICISCVSTHINSLFIFYTGEAKTLGPGCHASSAWLSIHHSILMATSAWLPATEMLKWVCGEVGAGGLIYHTVSPKEL